MKALKLACGSNLAHSDVACAVDDPKGVWAVAQACGANPVPVIVPCHRVLGKNDCLTGLSGGLAYKKRLLALEGMLPGNLLG